MRKADQDLFIEQTGEKVGVTVYKVLAEHVLTEEYTDVGIEYLVGFLGRIKLGKVPVPMFLAKRVVKSFLDNLMPEKILDLMGFLLVRSRLISSTDLERARQNG